jgi:hypothetical protein
VTAPSLDSRKLLEGTTPGKWSVPIEKPKYVESPSGWVAECFSEADARLIAAAPDLARRLAEREEYIRDLGWAEAFRLWVVETAPRAIAKGTKTEFSMFVQTALELAKKALPSAALAKGEG